MTGGFIAYRYYLPIEEFWTNNDHFVETCFTCGFFYYNQGHLEDAERVYNCALVGYDMVLGPEHASTLSTVNNLRALYSDQGHLKDVERMYDHALASFEKAWEPEHTSTFDTVNNLSILYKSQGHLEDAERMYNRALASYEKVLGPEHTSTLCTIHNLRLLYKSKALPKMQRESKSRSKGKRIATKWWPL